MPDPAIRPARPDDAQAVCGVYAWHVANGTGTFDTVGPDATQWAARIKDFAENGWPFLVAEKEGQVVGYCYAARFRDRAAYARTCENSIYVAHASRGQGIGRAMLAALVETAREAGFEQMIAVIGGGEPASAALHRALGFVQVGRLRNVGFKFGQRLDTVYMQRDLTGEGLERDLLKS